VAVGADHREAVPGDGEEHVVGEPCVDDPEQVRLAMLHRHPEGVVLGARRVVAGLAVDGVGVGDFDVAAGSPGLQKKLLRVGVPPLPKDDGHLPVRHRVGVGGAVILGANDDDAMHGGAAVVAVRVPPQRALFLGEEDAVGEAGARLDGALRDVLRPVGPWVPRLVHAVPVQGDVLAALVVHVDDDDVALARVDGRPGELPVHGQDGLLLAQPGDLGLLDLQKIEIDEIKLVVIYITFSVEMRSSIYRSTYNEVVVTSCRRLFKQQRIPGGLRRASCNSKG